MNTAADTNILLDLLSGGPLEAAAFRAIDEAGTLGRLLICPVVYAELGGRFPDLRALDQFLADFGIELDSFSSDALWQASTAWRAYLRRRGQQIQCPRCGYHDSLLCAQCQSPIVWRQHLITDFLIGGHAAAAADRLLTRDRGYYRTYFPQLPLVTPGASDGAAS